MAPETMLARLPTPGMPEASLELKTPEARQVVRDLWQAGQVHGALYIDAAPKGGHTPRFHGCLTLAGFERLERVRGIKAAV